MKTFKVLVREVWVQEYFVEAEDEKEAIKKVNGTAIRTEGEFEFSHCLSMDTWTAEEKQTSPEA